VHDEVDKKFCHSSEALSFIVAIRVEILNEN